MLVKKAIIPAAGLGVRFLPATKAQPKEMLPIVDKPTIQYIIEEAVASGIEDILIITGSNKRAIEDHFDKSHVLEMQLQLKGKTDLLKTVQDISNLAEIYYIRQKEPLGLGHAVYCARSFIKNEPFAVLLGDDIVSSTKPCLKQLMELYEEVQAPVLGIKEVPLEDVDKYGILEAEPVRPQVYKVSDLVEKPEPHEAPSRLAVMGRYIINPGIFDILENTKPGAGGEIQLTDALRVQGQAEGMYGLVFDGRRYDVGDKMGYLKATVEFALGRKDLKEVFSQYIRGIAENL
ncbi:UTP-glucose-1-phosphate uridylyltransferase [Desulfofarcimen acetoxidans DSM 771]|uniref:UTP--glucose-1-phosphate uridylyltransferase n=1 Tax=Desulfofarcimen acetoxidans (strain ATCC 49208 / DSM 771 / KCTC 5769 / VKM B-1644 / 5575) TaxID=485916 RepID=C8VYR1_DESAS|nr:UTP--glucose-1-phosphate uridylyltransferase GalU [Desulfofarcimen acetoxidans]ACV64782.1 UTP-glucose-1-phosphate uridylyltransferase [Desulfofarcimen acetoxidans DSM 771]